MKKVLLCVATAASVLLGSILLGSVGIGEASTERKTLVLDHFVVSKGTSANRAAFQYLVKVTNAGPLAGAGGPATVQLFLFNEDGTPLTREDRQPICSSSAPCQVVVQPGTAARFDLTQLAADAGGLEGAGQREVVTGFAILTIDGAGAAETNASAFFVNIHAGPFNASFEQVVLHEVTG